MSARTLVILAAAAVSSILCPSQSLACEPVVPLVMLYAGPLLWGGIVAKSAIGLLIAVLIKIAVFWSKSGINKIKGALYIVLANIYSTIPGILIAVAFSAPSSLLFVAIPLFLAFLIPAQNLKSYPYFRNINPGIIAFALFGVALSTVFIWGFARELLSESNYPAYWLVKILYSTIGIGLSFFITIVCETAVIAKLYERDYRETKSFLEPVIWANMVVFVILLGVGAAVTIPERFHSPGFVTLLLSVIGG